MSPIVWLGYLHSGQRNPERTAWTSHVLHLRPGEAHGWQVKRSSWWQHVARLPTLSPCQQQQQQWWQVQCRGERAFQSGKKWGAREDSLSLCRVIVNSSHHPSHTHTNLLHLWNQIWSLWGSLLLHIINYNVNIIETQLRMCFFFTTSLFHIDIHVTTP